MSVIGPSSDSPLDTGSGAETLLCPWECPLLIGVPMENRSPSVFVSSTMYDLSVLRAQLRRFIEGLGWIAVMAEHGSFAIDANQTTVDNSLRNVRENADIFVMIVGARNGSVDPDSGRSVTNLEFLEARARGVPAYVFVDTPRVFEFID